MKRLRFPKLHRPTWIQIGEVVGQVTRVALTVVIVVCIWATVASRNDYKGRSIRLQKRVDEISADSDALTKIVTDITSDSAKANNAAATTALVAHAVVCINNHLDHVLKDTPINPTCS